MGVFAGPEIDIVQIGMAVELDQPQGPPFAQCPQDRQRAQMIAAAGQRQNPRRAEPGIKPLDPGH